jgi:CRP-like cAMP-binding protein
MSVAEDERIALASPLLALAPRAAAAGLIAAARPRTLEPGDALFAQDDAASDAFVVIEGWIALVRRDREGRDAVVEVFTRGESIAEAPALLGERYPVAAEAAVRSRVLAVPGAALRDAVLADPAAALGVVAAAYRQMRGLLAQVKQLKARTAPERLARFLADLAPPGAREATVALPFEKALIAARLGMTPSSLSRAFRTLRPAGLMIDDGSAHIADVAALRAYGRGDETPRRRP